MIARVLVVALLAACGSRSVGPKRPADTRTDAEVLAGLKPGEPIVLTPESRSAAMYNPRELGPVPESELSDAILGAVVDAAAGAGHAAPIADPRLFAVAADLAPVATEDGPIPYALVEFALRHNGLIEPSPHIILIWGPLDRGDVIADQLRQRLPEIFGSTKIARVGIGAELRGDIGVILLVLQPSFIETEPIPRTIAAGKTFDVHARILPPYQNPEVFITHETGKVTQPKVVIGEGGRIVARVSCEGHKGAQQIEITAVDVGGSAVLANFPVWCGEDPPRTATITPTIAGPVDNAADAERQMLALVNRDRKEGRLPPLVVDAVLSDIARGHSDEMHSTGDVAHVSPTTGSAADRVKAGGVSTALVLENVARAYGVSEAQQGLMNSPGHRANILSHDATHIGIGITLGDNSTGQRELFVTQVFTRVPPKIDPAQAQQDLIADIKAASSLRPDADLTAIAQAFAKDIAGGSSNEQASTRSAKGLDKLSSRFRRVTTIVNPVADLATFPIDAVKKDTAMTHYGVGLAQGDHDMIGKGAIYIVVLIGQQR